jgi:GDP-4-dehydro-6-deoxy-D-mannose reductase
VNATLVTGAAGFVGGHLLEHLAARHGHTASRDLVAWARSEPPRELANLARWDRIDLLNRDVVRSAVAALRPSTVYHCAGVAHVAQSWADTATAYAGNVLTTHYLLDALRRIGAPCRVLIPGSATIYAPSDLPIPEDGRIAPTSPYALSKLAQETLGARAVQEDGIDVILTRSFNHIGPRQAPAFSASSFAQQIAHIERGGREAVIRVGNLSPRRDVTDVRDVVAAYVALVDRGVPGTVYNVASGEGRSIQSMLDALVSRATVSVRVEVDPALFRLHDTPALVGDSRRLRDATGWSPGIPFEQMLDDLLAYWRRAA